MHTADGTISSDGYSSDGLLDEFGTPPTRRDALQRVLSNKKSSGGPKPPVASRARGVPSKWVPRNGATPPPSGLQRKASKDRRQKQRLAARAFKELDATLEVLGITAAATLDRGDAGGGVLAGSGSQGTLATSGSQASLTAPSPRSTSGSRRGAADAATPGASGAGDAGSHARAMMRAQLSGSGRASPSLPPSAPLLIAPPKGSTTTWAQLAARPAAGRSQSASPAPLPPTAAGLRGRGAAPAANSSNRRAESAPHWQQPVQHPSPGISLVGGGGGSGGSIALDELTPRRCTTPGLASSGGLSARERIAADRASLHSELNSLLEKRVEAEDVAGGVADALETASDLCDQLVALHTPPTGWQELSDAVRWGDKLVAKANNILRNLDPFRPYMDDEQDACVGSARRRMLAELAAHLSMCMQQARVLVEEQLGEVRGESELSLPASSLTKLVQVARALARDIRRGGWPVGSGDVDVGEAGEGLGYQAACCVESLLEASNEVAADLLRPRALAAGGAVHATANRARCLRAMWRTTTEVVARVCDGWPGRALEMQGMLCGHYLDVGRRALVVMVGSMQRQGVLPVAPESRACSPRGSEGGDGSAAGSQGVSRGAGSEGGEGESEEDEEDDALPLMAEGVGPLMALLMHAAHDGERAGGLNGRAGTTSYSGGPDDEYDAGIPSSSGSAWPVVLPAGSTGSGLGYSRPSPGAGLGPAQAAWGGVAAMARPGVRSPTHQRFVVKDEDVQAQAWLPALLLQLHARAEEAASRLRDAMVSDPDLGGSAREGELSSLLDELQECFSALVLANARRTAALVSLPGSLALYAVELAGGAAEDALRLVLAYDLGSLGLGALLQKMAERESGEVIEEGEYEGEGVWEDNDTLGARNLQAAEAAAAQIMGVLKALSFTITQQLLAVKRLIKVRRAGEEDAEAGGANGKPMVPAPLPVVPPVRPAAALAAANPAAPQVHKPSTLTTPFSISVGSQRQQVAAAPAPATSPFAAAVAVAPTVTVSPPPPGRTSPFASPFMQSPVATRPATCTTSHTTPQKAGQPVGPLTTSRAPSCDPVAGAWYAGPTPDTHAAAATASSSIAAAAGGRTSWAHVATRGLPQVSSTATPPVRPPSDKLSAPTQGASQVMAQRGAPTAATTPAPADPPTPSDATTSGVAEQGVAWQQVEGKLKRKQQQSSSQQQPGQRGGSGGRGRGRGQEGDNRGAPRGREPATGDREGPHVRSSRNEGDERGGRGRRGHSRASDASSDQGAAAQAPVTAALQRPPAPVPQPAPALRAPHQLAAAPRLQPQQLPASPPAATVVPGSSARGVAAAPRSPPSTSPFSQSPAPLQHAVSPTALMATPFLTPPNLGSLSRLPRSSSGPLPGTAHGLVAPTHEGHVGLRGGRLQAGTSQAAAATHAVPAGAGPGAGGGAGGGGGGGDDAFWSIPFAHLRNGLIQQLGSGSFGTVWKGRWFHAEVAIKVVTIDRDMEVDATAIERFRREVDLQRRLSHHPNIVRFMGACCEYELAGGGGAGAGGASDAAGNAGDNGHHGSPGHSPGMLAIVMEFARLGSLFKMLKSARAARAKAAALSGAPPTERAKGMATLQRAPGYRFYSSWDTRLSVAAGAAAGVEFMHAHGVVHRDLTSSNLVLDAAGSSWVAKVCDFNLSRAIPTASVSQLLAHSGRTYSPLWASPELLRGDAYGKASDVYSFGVILYEVLTLAVPYTYEEEEGGEPGPGDDDANPRAIDVLMEQVKVHVPTGRMVPVLPDDAKQLPAPSPLDAGVYSRLRALAAACWETAPERRPAMSAVAQELADVLELVRAGARAAQQQAAAAAAGASGQGAAGVAGAAPVPPHTPPPPTTVSGARRSVDEARP